MHRCEVDSIKCGSGRCAIEADGMERYNKDKDKSFEDVFKRADKRMYECKWIMKQNNG